MKRLSLRLRLTALSVLLLTVCCVGLTIILTFSANHMADVIEATPMLPATEVGEGAMMLPPAMTALTPSEGAEVARNRFQYQSVFCMVLVIVAGGGFTYYTTGKALKPLQVLSSQMKNRTVHNLSEELTVPQSRDEIADLTDSFNHMSHKLDEAFAMQKRFSQSAAHELRTPLSVLKTKVDVFKKRRSHSPEEYDKLLSVITTHTDRLAELVKDLLDLTNMDALDCEETIELNALLSEVALELTPLTAEKRIAILLEGGAREVSGNKSLLHRVFYNLLENAIKYNVENGTVNITVSGEGNLGQVLMQDSGIGIPPASLKLIFEPFYRVDQSRSRQMGGAGLGLATVKAIIEKHHGTIEVSSDSKSGTRFQIQLCLFQK